MCLKNTPILIIKRLFSSASQSAKKLRPLKREINTDKHNDAKYIRNIGIIAHIDAGKTTTTERMLFASGKTKFIGEVDDGTTVTDYMDQERDRGITITSASISFPWKDNLINLIDTPGHVDFTIEVERSLRILDGAVAVLDASAGVEAQTLTVWLQADRYNLPRIIYLNKMDKERASFTDCIKDIKKKLNVKPLITQMPLGNGKSFTGAIDLVNLRAMKWERDSNDMDYDLVPLNNFKQEEIRIKSLEMRSILVEELADLDDDVAESLLSNESPHLVPPNVIQTSLKKMTQLRKGVPIMLGSSYKNICVQPLMDSICSYLPSPNDVHHPKVDLYSPNLCAVAFKIIHHKRLGLLTFIRIYSGELHKGQNVYNANKGETEKIGKLYVPYADELNEVNCAGNGSIIVISGLKTTITGDTIVNSANDVKEARMKQNKKNSDDSEILVGVKIPEPVFMCSIEAPSLSHQVALDSALNHLQKEDPSLTVKVDEETGQIILAGMGELHLNIIRDRICNEYKVEAELGPLQVSYRETLNEYKKCQVEVDKIIGGVKQAVKIILSLEPKPGYTFKKIECAYNRENYENLQSVQRQQMEAVRRGVSSTLMAGSISHSPVIDVLPKIHWLEVGRGTSDAMIAAAASQCILKILKESDCSMLEPVMQIEIVTPEDRSDKVLHELYRRRATINDIGYRPGVKIIHCFCPLAELVGFASTIREMTSGMGNLSLEFSYYKKLTFEEQTVILQQMSGFSIAK